MKHVPSIEEKLRTHPGVALKRDSFIHDILRGRIVSEVHFSGEASKVAKFIVDLATEITDLCS